MINNNNNISNRNDSINDSITNNNDNERSTPEAVKALQALQALVRRLDAGGDRPEVARTQLEPLV